MFENPLATSKLCPKCGGTINADSKFCKHCAFKLTVPSPVGNIITPGTEQEGNRTLLWLLVGIGGAVILTIIIVAVSNKRINNQAGNSVTPSTTTATSSVTSSNTTMSARAVQVEDKILQGEQLSDSDIAGLSPYELRVLRNVHFARHGRQFERPGLGDYFYSRPWYSPISDYSSSSITDTDRANIDVIHAAEARYIVAQSMNWNSFWDTFSTAVERHDRFSLRVMMSDNFESGGGGENADEWLDMIIRGKSWPQLQQTVASGTKSFSMNDATRPARITNDDALIFEQGPDGRWRFTAIMGD